MPWGDVPVEGPVGAEAVGEVEDVSDGHVFFAGRGGYVEEEGAAIGSGAAQFVEHGFGLRSRMELVDDLGVLSWMARTAMSR